MYMLRSRDEKLVSRLLSILIRVRVGAMNLLWGGHEEYLDAASWRIEVNGSTEGDVGCAVWTFVRIVRACRG